MSTLSITNYNPQQVWDETMDGNKDAFVESGLEGIQGGSSGQYS